MLIVLKHDPDTNKVSDSIIVNKSKGKHVEKNSFIHLLEKSSVNTLPKGRIEILGGFKIHDFLFLVGEMMQSRTL